jgi:hypothetical protein
MWFLDHKRREPGLGPEGGAVTGRSIASGANLFLTEQFAGLRVDEMNSGAGRARHLPIRVLHFVRLVRQPVLDVHSGTWTFEEDVAAHTRHYGNTSLLRKLRMFA